MLEGGKSNVDPPSVREEKRSVQRKGIFHERASPARTITARSRGFLKVSKPESIKTTPRRKANSPPSLPLPLHFRARARRKLKINGSVVRYALYPSTIFFSTARQPAGTDFPLSLMKVRFNILPETIEFPRSAQMEGSFLSTRDLVERSIRALYGDEQKR